MTTRFDYELFGLEPRDLIVYETLLKQNTATSIRSVAEQVHMNRGTTYEVIKKLTQYGLITTHYRNRRKYYAAADPDALQSFAYEKVSIATQELNSIQTYTDELRERNLEGTVRQFTQFYDGEEEIAALLRDVLTTVSALSDKTYHVISSAEIKNHLYKKFRNFTRQRIKLGLHVKVIGVGELGARTQYAERKLLDTTKAPACYIIIYGSKVAQISFSEVGNVEGVVVDNEGVASLQRLMFDKLWESLLA